MWALNANAIIMSDDFLPVYWYFRYSFQQNVAMFVS